MKEKIPFKYKELEEASHDKRFKSIWECVAFRLGAMWAVNKIYTEKTSEEILREIEAPIITCNDNFNNVIENGVE